MGVNLATGYVELVPSAQGFVAKMKSELGGPLESEGKSSGERVGAGFAGAFAGHMKMAGVAAAGILAGAVGVGGALFKIGSTFDDAFDTIRVGTGATGVALDGLKESLKTVGTTVPSSFDDASTAISELNKRLGLTGKPLEDISGQILNLSRITNTDLNTNIETVSRAMGDWGFTTEQMTPKLDSLFRASQLTGPSVSKLSELMTTFGGPMRQLGFSFEETAAMLGKFEKEGVNTELVMGSMRIALGKMAKEGVQDVPAALRTTIDSIKNAGSAGEANAKALELFGAKAGPDMAAAIREGRFDIDGLVSQIANGTETIGSASADTADFAESWQLFKNKVSVALEPLASRVFGAVGTAMEKVGPIAEGVIAKVIPILKEISGGVQAFFAAFAAGNGDVTSDGFAGGMEQLANKAREVFDFLKGIDWAGVFNQAKDVIVPVAVAVGELATAVADFAVTHWPTVQNAIQTAAPIIKDVLVTTLGAATTVIKFLADNMNIAGPAILAVAAGFAAIKAIQGVNTMVTGAVTAVQGYVTHTKAALTAAQSFGSGLLSVGRSVVSFGVSVATTTAKVIAQGVAFLAQRVAALASAAAQGVMTAAQWLLNAAMAANPITLIVIAIAALVAGFVLLYMKCEPVRQIIDAIGAAIMGALKAAVDWITNTAIPAVTGFVTMIAEKLTGAINWFAELPGRIVSAIGDLAGTLIEKGVSLIRGFIEGYIRIWTEVIQFYVSIPGKILEFIGDVGRLLWDKGSAILNSIKDGAASVWTAVSGWFAEIPGKITNAVGNVGRLLYNVGSDIVNGLRDGLSGAWHKVTSFISDAVSKIPGPVRSILGIGSPSKVFAEIGLNLTEGLVVGLTAGVPMVEKAILNTAKTLLGQPMKLAPVTAPHGVSNYSPAGLTDANGRASSPGVQGGDINLTINQSGLADPMATAKEVSFRMKTLGR